MKYKIALLPGDGIGPEVIDQAVNVLKSMEEVSDVSFEFTQYSIGADSIEKHGNPCTEETIEGCKHSDAVLFGAIGDPKFDNAPDIEIRPEQGLLKLRKELALFANVRPVKAYENLICNSPLKEEIIRDVDFVIYRELTGGIYFGKKMESEEASFDTCGYTEIEITRILKLAFEAAEKRSKKLTLVDKANVMATSRMWRRLAQKMSKSYPEIELDMLFVDNAAMQIILNPKQFDVLVTSNMFGDILSDEASVIAGSLGLLASASVGKHTALFEPIHGSFPQAKGKGIANPVGSILSAAMMLEHLGEEELAKDIQSSVEQSFNEGVVTSELDADSNFTTQEVGSYIALDVIKRITQKSLQEV